MGEIHQVGVDDSGFLKAEKVQPIQSVGSSDAGLSGEAVNNSGSKKGQENQITVEQLDSLLIALEGRLQLEIDKYIGGQ